MLPVSSKHSLTLSLRIKSLRSCAYLLMWPDVRLAWILHVFDPVSTKIIIYHLDYKIKLLDLDCWWNSHKSKTSCILWETWVQWTRLNVEDHPYKKNLVRMLLMCILLLDKLWVTMQRGVPVHTICTWSTPIDSEYCRFIHGSVYQALKSTTARQFQSFIHYALESGQLWTVNVSCDFLDWM